MKERFFEMAKECAEESDFSGASKAKIGCVAVYKGTIIAKGFNTMKTSPTQKQYNKRRFNTDTNHYYPSFNHAETMIYKKIRYLDIDFSKVKIYLFRSLRNGSIAMSRPCPSCFAMLRDLGIKEIYYTTPDGFAHETIKERENE